MNEHTKRIPNNERSVGILKKSTKERSTNTGFWILVSGSVLLFLLLVLAVPNLYYKQLGREIDEKSPSDINSSIRDREVTDRGGEVDGTRINLIGDVERVIGNRAFVIDGPGVFGDRLLVLTKWPIDDIENEGKDVTELLDGERQVVVSGVIQEFDMNKLNYELDMELSGEEYTDFLGGPVLVADIISIRD